MIYVDSVGAHLPCSGTTRHLVMQADVDVTELHESFTAIEPIRYEGQGFTRQHLCAARVMKGPFSDGR